MVLMNLSAEEQWRHRPREQTCEDGRVGGAEGGTDGESGVETHTQPYVKQPASGSLLYDSGSANWCSVTVEGVGWGERWEGSSRGRGQVCVLFLVAQWCPTLRPHGLEPTRLLCPSGSPAKNTGVGCHALFQGIFPTQGSKPGLLHCRRILHQLSHQGSLDTCVPVADSC